MYFGLFNGFICEYVKLKSKWEKYIILFICISPNVVLGVGLRPLYALEQDFSNQSILAESQYLGLTKTFTVGFKHLGFQKFQCLTLSTFNGQAEEV